MKQGIAVTLLVALCLPARADVVHFKDGRKIEGKVTDLGDRLKIERKIGSILVNKDDVLRVEPKEFVEAPAPVPAPAAPAPAAGAVPASSPVPNLHLRPRPKVRLLSTFTSLDGAFVLYHPVTWGGDGQLPLRGPKESNGLAMDILVSETADELPALVDIVKAKALIDWPGSVLLGSESYLLNGRLAVQLEFFWAFELRKWHAFVQLVKNEKTLVTTRVVGVDPAFVNHWYEADRIMRSIRFFKGKETSAVQRKLAIDLLDRGNAENKAGKHEGALRCFKECVEIIGPIAVVQTGLTRAYLGQKEYRSAVIAAKDGLKAEPEHVTLLWLLAFSYYLWGKEEDAAQALKKVMAVDPDNDEAFLYAGLLLADKGKWADAKDAWKRGVEANPESARLHLALGEAWEKLGKPRDAQECYQKCLQLDPNSAEARQRLDGVRNR